MPPVFAFTDYKNRVLSAFYAIIMNKNSHAFPLRKVRQRTFSRTHQFILAKLLRFQRTFHEKSFVSGFGADSPNIQCTQKKHGIAVLFYFSKYVGTAVRGPCFKGLLKKPLKIRKTFAPTTPLHFGKTFEDS